MSRFNPLRRWRPLCALLGCHFDPDAPYSICTRCHATDFDPMSQREPMFGLYGWLRDMKYAMAFLAWMTADRIAEWWSGPACMFCRKRPATFRHGQSIYCSQKCCSDDIPF